MHTPSRSSTTRSYFRTPTRSSSRKSRTRSTPSSASRYVPRRPTEMELEISSYAISKENAPSGCFDTSPSKEAYKERLAEGMFEGAMPSQGRTKVLAFNKKAPAARSGHQNRNSVLYSQHSGASSTRKTVRHIPTEESNILDAPGLVDDYYLNLLDWSARNMVAVAFGKSVYLWNASDGAVTQLCESPVTITSLSWVKEHSLSGHIAVGTQSGSVLLYDAETQKLRRKMGGHSARVGAMDWNSGSLLATGGRDSKVIVHDVRKRNAMTAEYRGHEQEVCGLRWSPDDSQFATGGNDNLLHIWDPRTSTRAMHRKTDHVAAVKALDYCPWQRNLLASGGGTADRHIRFWNTETGACLNSVDTKSQVCSIKWSRHHRELVSSHGYSQNQLIVWKYPSLVKIAELKGHKERVLHMALSPDGNTVVSAAADETIRFWKIFESRRAPAAKATKPAAASRLSRFIR